MSQKGMPTDGEKVVWILGAGFSRPLGLPLASELFSTRYEKIAEGFASPILVSPENVQARILDSYNKLASGYAAFRGPINKPKPLPQVVNKRLVPKLKLQDIERESPALLRELATAISAATWFAGVPETDGYIAALRQCQADLRAFCDALIPLLEPATEEDIHTADSAWQAAESWLAGPSPYAKGKLRDAGKDACKTREDHRKAIAQALIDVRKVEEQKGWTAEELLVSLDKAAKTDLTHLRLWSDWGGNADRVPTTVKPTSILKAVTALIAAQMEFAIPQTTDPDKAGYAWKPYINWAKTLVGPKDTILTFNYDRVVEKAFEFAGRKLPPGQLLKLHGSVSQGQERGKPGLVDISVKDLHLQIRGFKPMTVKLGLPGESKSAIHRKGGLLEDVWKQAGEAISDADTIVFVGYTLPPEDVEAMAMIVDNIRPSEPLQSGPRIRVALGPGLQEAKLIAAILKQHSGDFRNEGLYTQHLLTTWTREDLVPSLGFLS